MNPAGISAQRNLSGMLTYFSLFTSLSTLLCCALPSLLVLVGLGATVASVRHPGSVGGAVHHCGENRSWMRVPRILFADHIDGAGSTFFRLVCGQDLERRGQAGERYPLEGFKQL